MASRLLLPLGIAGAGFLAIAVPFLQRTVTLLHLTHDFSQPIIPESCKLEHEDLFQGCEDMRLTSDGRYIFTACLTNWDNRLRTWDRSTGEGGVSGDKIFRWDLEKDDVKELELVDFPGLNSNASYRSFHGIDINEHPDGKSISLYIINHPDTGSVVEKFSYDLSEDNGKLKHLKRIESTSDSAPLKAPNAVFTLPELDSEDAFYVANDHGGTTDWEREIEYVGRRAWAEVWYYSTSTGWKRSLSGIYGSCGMTGSKEVENRKVYVSETPAGMISVYSTKKDAPGELEKIQEIDFAAFADNLVLSGDDLYVAGGARILKWSGARFSGLLSGPGGPGSLVKRINTKQLGSAFFGEGYTAAPTVETVFEDGFGIKGNMSSTALLRYYKTQEVDDEESEARPKGDLLVTGLYFSGILRCPNFS